MDDTKQAEKTGNNYGGKQYFGIRILRQGKPRRLYVYADEISIEDGNLLLLRNDKEYRAFAPGVWLDVFAADEWDGNELGEVHDRDDRTAEFMAEELRPDGGQHPA